MHRHVQSGEASTSRSPLWSITTWLVLRRNTWWNCAILLAQPSVDNVFGRLLVVISLFRGFGFRHSAIGPSLSQAPKFGTLFRSGSDNRVTIHCFSNRKSIFSAVLSGASVDPYLMMGLISFLYYYYYYYYIVRLSYRTIVTSSHRHITVSTHRHITVSTHRHITVSTHRHITVSTHRHITVSTHRHITVSTSTSHHRPRIFRFPHQKVVTSSHPRIVKSKHQHRQQVFTSQYQCIGPSCTVTWSEKWLLQGWTNSSPVSSPTLQFDF